MKFNQKEGKEKMCLKSMKHYYVCKKQYLSFLLSMLLLGTETCTAKQGLPTQYKLLKRVLKKPESQIAYK
jgi:hypothetical protein